MLAHAHIVYMHTHAHMDYMHTHAHMDYMLTYAHIDYMLTYAYINTDGSDSISRKTAESSTAALKLFCSGI